VERTAAEHGAVHLLVTDTGGPPAGASGAFSLDEYRGRGEREP
jgi:3-oxoacyl-[acyl-carrier protein] reductase